MKRGGLIAAVVLLLWFAPGGALASTPAEAIALEQQGRLSEAAEAWRSVIAKNPRDAGAHASLGVVLSRQNKYAEASVAYRKAIALDPALPGIQLNWGLAEFKQGNFHAAIPRFRAALKANPGNFQARTLLGFSYYGAKEYAKAVEYLRLSLQSDPENPQLRQYLAQSCMWAREYSCALTEFRRILETAPDSPSAHILLGQALDGVGKTADAIAEFEIAAKAAPKEPSVHFGLGYLYWKSHEYEKARKAFETELSLDPIHAQSLAYLGDIEVKDGRAEKAVLLLKKAIELQKDLRFAYIALGVALTDLQQYTDALGVLQQAAKLDPSQADAHYRIARVYQALGRTEEAQKEFAKVRELHQKSDEALTPKMPNSPPPLP